MEVTNVVQEGNTLTAQFIIESKNSTSVSTSTSPKYLISASTVLQVRIVSTLLHLNGYKNFVFLRFTKCLFDDVNNYIIKFTSNELGIRSKCFTSDEGTWRLLQENVQEKFNFKVFVQMEIVPCANSFASLHEDSELTDFELRSGDGSIHMHRAVLAAASPVLRRMLSGTWRETAEGCVVVPDTSKATLQHFKDYVYLRTLPESGLEELLLLASYYMMPELEQRCVGKLVRNLSAVNACDMIVFAVKHNVPRLLLGTLKSVKSGSVSIVDIVDHFTRTNTKVVST